METNPFRLQPRPGGSPAAGAPSPAGPGRGRRAGADAGGEPRALPAGRMRAWVAAAVEGKSWLARAPLLLPLGWIFWGYLRDRTYRSIFDGLTLGFHEAGHAAFMWLGNDLLTTAGGTIFQIGIPLAASAYLLLRQKDPFGATVGTFWMGTALVGAGVYAADARAQALPLVSPFGPVDASSHDWTVMLLRFGRISRDQEIGAALQGAGMLSMGLSLLLAVWILALMASAGGRGARGAPLYDPAEETRLSTFLSGGTVERQAPKRMFKRAPERAGNERPGGPASAPRGADPLAGEDERFRRFLDREGDPRGRP